MSLASENSLIASERGPRLLFTFKIPRREAVLEEEDEDVDPDYLPNVDEEEEEEDDKRLKSPKSSKTHMGSRKLVSLTKKKKKKKKRAGLKRRSSSDDDDDEIDDIELKSHSPKKKTRRSAPLLAPQIPVSCYTCGPEAPKSLPAANLWQALVPQEILLGIFKFVVPTEGVVAFSHKARKICPLWEKVAGHPSLWHKVDLSVNFEKARDDTLEWYCVNRLSAVRDLSLSRWKKLRFSSIQILTQYCTLLHTINLSRCPKIDAAALKLLADSCCHLENWDLSYMPPKTISCGLKYIIETAGGRLKQLNISGNLITGLTAIFNSMCDCCPKLEVLEVCDIDSVTSSVSLNIPRMQCGWRQLRILRLSNLQFNMAYVPLKTKIESPGFVALRELSVTNVNEHNKSVNGDFLSLALKTSHDLHLLDLRGCIGVLPQCLQGLPLTNLRYLFLSRTSASKEGSLAAMMCKWQHSLHEIDLSWIPYNEATFELMSEALLDSGGCPELHTMDLTGTAISTTALGRLLACCPHLTSLNLTSCRGLPRGTKRQHVGATALQQLHSDVG